MKAATESPAPDVAVRDENVPADEAARLASSSVLQYAMEREKLFRETFELAAVGFVHTSLRGTILRTNQRACSLLGYSAAELRGLNFLDITHAEDVPNNVREFKRALAGEFDTYKLEQRLRC
jgi:PAS domain S-box-containing protein